MIKIVANLPPPPEPSVECCQRCASCQWVPCDSLKEHFEFCKEIPPAQSFSKICREENRAADNFHNCLACRDILSCSILKRAMTPEPPKRRVSWFVDHALLFEGENFSLIKVLRRLASILSR